jgi:Domain of unknown function (DUF4145)
MAEPEPTTFAAICPGCDKPVAMIIRGLWSAWHPDFEGPPEEWTAASCPECCKATLYVQEDLGNGLDDRFQIYPAQDRRMSMSVPRSLREDHEEARRCLRSKCYRAAAIMARRIVEGVCVENGQKKGSLFTRLKKMRDDGVIDGRLYEWADACRELGNQGAHGSDTSGRVAREDAEEVVALVEALLDYLYVFQARFGDFMARRAAAKGGADAM